jgi:hypothetical protein
MSDSDGEKADLLAKAKKQMAAMADEFGKGLAAVKDPAKRNELTVAYLDIVQKYLAKAQETVAHSREKRQAHQSATDIPPTMTPPSGPPGDVA